MAGFIFVYCSPCPMGSKHGPLLVVDYLTAPNIPEYQNTTRTLEATYACSLRTAQRSAELRGTTQAVMHAVAHDTLK